MHISADCDRNKRGEAEFDSKRNTAHVEDLSGPEIVNASEECIVDEEGCRSSNHCLEPAVGEVTRNDHALFVVRFSPSFVFLSVSPPKE